MAAVAEMEINADAPIPTWFGTGGRADRLAHPRTLDDLRRCLDIDPGLRVLGDGANLLVDDDGVGGLVVSLKRLRASPQADGPGVSPISRVADGGVVAAAGADLPRVILECARLGLAGLEGLGGIPATVGGAAVMNAGGAFGEFADAVARVHVLARDGQERTLERSDIDAGYRHGGLAGLIVTRVEFALTPAHPTALRSRLKKVMVYKKESQPLREASAGCAFKNPVLARDLAQLAGAAPDAGARAGERTSAGLLIDRAGCKGMAVGGAAVSTRHANFITTRPGAKARDVIDLMNAVAARVLDRFGVRLEPEVVVWRRDA